MREGLKNTPKTTMRRRKKAVVPSYGTSMRTNCRQNVDVLLVIDENMEQNTTHKVNSSILRDTCTRRYHPCENKPLVKKSAIDWNNRSTYNCILDDKTMILGLKSYSSKSKRKRSASSKINYAEHDGLDSEDLTRKQRYHLRHIDWTRIFKKVCKRKIIDIPLSELDYISNIAQDKDHTSNVLLFTTKRVRNNKPLSCITRRTSGLCRRKNYLSVIEGKSEASAELRMQ